MGSPGGGTTPAYTRARVWLVALAAILSTATAIVSTTPAGAQAPGTVAGDGADRVIFWLGCERIAKLTDAELDEWKSRGVDGFVCQVGHLRHMGGTQDFTGDPAASLDTDNYELQRALRDSQIVERAAARDMKMYLGTYLVNYSNLSTPLHDWFDDAGWSDLVLPKMTELAAAAKMLGFAGLAFDQELYPQRGNVESASWNWDYPGNTHSEAEVRAKAKQRGAQVMGAIVGAFPGAELVAYAVEFPETWHEAVQQIVNEVPDAFASRLDIDFWDGLSSVEGYGAIRLIDAIFYKSPQVGTWDNALEYNANRLASLLSRRFSNWEYAASRFFVSPYSWIDPGPQPSSFDDARPPSYVAEQLLAFRKWGMGGELANYVYDDHLETFDYSPYVGALQAASTPGAVDSEDPTVTIANRDPGQAATVAGSAHDNLAVWAVRWRDDLGGSGVAELNWNPVDGDYKAGFDWNAQWSVPESDVSPDATRVTITAQDIKGRTSQPTTVSLVDDRAPQTKISSRLRGRKLNRTVTIRFRADERPVDFECKIDRRRWTGCDRGRATYRLQAGPHRFMVRATDQAGNTDATAAKARFRVER